MAQQFLIFVKKLVIHIDGLLTLTLTPKRGMLDIEVRIGCRNILNDKHEVQGKKEYRITL